MIIQQRAHAVLVCAAASFAGAGLPLPAAAWGNEGHEIIATIAYARLLPAVRKRVDKILAMDKDTLTAPGFASRATWADRYRDSDRGTTQVHYLQTRAWHFVDIEIDGGSLGAACPADPPIVTASSGPAADCVVNKIGQFFAELADSKTPAVEKRLALKFLLHFVGDVHQPLHASDHRDAGGNDVAILYPGIRTASNLHAYWDTRLVRLLGADPRAVGATIAGTIAPADAASWASLSPALWAIESNEEARNTAYQLGDQAIGTDSKGLEVIELSPSYDARALPVVRQQLAKAGVRLADTLNAALR